jgi:hypothetical protein
VVRCGSSFNFFGIMYDYTIGLGITVVC